MAISPNPEETNSVTMPRRCLETSCIYIIIFVVGSSSGIMGPTLVHMTILYNTDAISMATVFTCLNIGYFFGSMCAGLIFDRYNALIQNAVAVAALGLSLAVAPHMPNLLLYQLMIGLDGFFQGYIFSAVPSQMVRIWKDSKIMGPAIQASNTMWFMGCISSQYIALPFLVDLPSPCRISNRLELVDITKRHINVSVMNHSASEDLNGSMKYDTNRCDIDVTCVGAAFTVIGLLALVGSISHIALYFGTRNPRDDTVSQTMDRRDITYIGSCCDSPLFQNALIATATFMFFCLISYESLPTNYLSTFVIEGLGRDIRNGPFVTSLFLASECIGSSLSIPLSYYVSPEIMVPVLLSISVTSFSALSFSESLNIPVFRLFVITAGLGCSSMRSFIVLLLEQYVTITCFIGGLFLMSASVAGLMSSYIVASLLQYTYLWLMYVCVTASLMGVASYIVFMLLVKLCYRAHSAEKLIEKDESDVSDKGYYSFGDTTIPE